MKAEKLTNIFDAKWLKEKEYDFHISFFDEFSAMCQHVLL